MPQKSIKSAKSQIRDLTSHKMPSKQKNVVAQRLVRLEQTINKRRENQEDTGVAPGMFQKFYSKFQMQQNNVLQAATDNQQSQTQRQNMLMDFKSNLIDDLRFQKNPGYQKSSGMRKLARSRRLEQERMENQKERNKTEHGLLYHLKNQNLIVKKIKSNTKTPLHKEVTEDVLIQNNPAFANLVTDHQSMITALKNEEQKMKQKSNFAGKLTQNYVYEKKEVPKYMRKANEINESHKPHMQESSQLKIKEMPFSSNSDFRQCKVNAPKSILQNSTTSKLSSKQDNSSMQLSHDASGSILPELSHRADKKEVKFQNFQQ